MAQKKGHYEIVTARYARSAHSNVPVVCRVAIVLDTVTEWMALSGASDAEFMMFAMEDGEAVAIYRHTSTQTIVRSETMGRSRYRFHAKDIEALIQQNRFYQMSKPPLTNIEKGQEHG